MLMYYQLVYKTQWKESTDDNKFLQNYHRNLFIFKILNI